MTSALMLSLIRFLTMKWVWAVFKAHPYISNILGYTALFASADLVQQSVLGEKPATGSTSEDLVGVDWHQIPIRYRYDTITHAANFSAAHP